MPSDQPVSDASINQEDEVLSRRQMVAAGGGLVAAGAAMSGMFPSRSEAQEVDTQQGVGAMLSGFIPAGWFWRLRTENITGWNPPDQFTTLDGQGYYVTAPFTGALNQLTAPPLNTWQQNTAGAAVYLSLPAAIVEETGQNGHIYLEASPDGTTIRRLGFLALRTGAMVT
jgi:hypothetical protein